MPAYRIAIIPGDGVGNEVAEEALKILMAVAENIHWIWTQSISHGVVIISSAAAL